MDQRAIPAAFIRGGTSKGLFFHDRDLPDEAAARHAVFLAAIGSPDAYGRQLDGMGGGISSLSKVMVVRPSAREDADVDYTFGQVAVAEELVDERSNCGNLTSAIGPFAVDEGLVQVADGEARLRLYNTNSDKIVVSRFAVADGRAVVEGAVALPGVSGRGAAIRLDFLDPGGATTGRLLPTGNVVDRLSVPGLGEIEASLVDAATAAVFVAATDLGLQGTEMPEALEATPGLLDRLEAIRRAAAVAMGLPPISQSAPKIGFVATPAPAATLAGEALPSDAMDVNARMISMGRPHRALPLTGALCLAAAARLTGSTVWQAAGGAEEARALRIAQPSGIMGLEARVSNTEGWQVDSVTAIRTARRLMEGRVLVPEARLASLAG
ncbi:MAG: PrpF domain-containing protein [Alphaproteobacteria bacterium]|jgi:hypothetical protein|nr:PrpF domain-containing protein [Alphaproteobacteria bacterium]